MSGVSEFYNWWITNEVTGERVLTPYKLTRAHAALAFPGAEPDLHSRELRDLPDVDALPWADSESELGGRCQDVAPGDTIPGHRWAETKPGK